jgi:diguanylate cyclase (GGDEF)-like protein
LSIGIATYPEDGTTSKELISSADNALYESKNNGRNLVSLTNRR